MRAAALRALAAAAACALAAPVPAAAGSCDEACLLALAERTVAAVAARDHRSLPWADPVAFTENDVPLQLGDGWWGSAGAETGPRAFAMADTASGDALWIGTVRDHDAPAFAVVRIHAPDGKIADLEVIAARTPWPVPFGDPRAFSLSPRMSQPVAPADRRSRQRLIDLANGYLATKQRNDGTLLAAFAPDCAMIENGVQIGSAEGEIEPPKQDCASVFRAGLFAPVDRIRDRRFPLVDPARGLVLAISTQDLPARSASFRTTDGRTVALKRPYPMSRLVAELIRIEGDRIVRAEGVAASLPFYMPSPRRTAGRR